MVGTLVNFNGLLTGAKLFDIPTYQRSYAWEEDNLKDLWEDLYYLDPSKDHFFGTVLLKDSGRTYAGWYVAVHTLRCHRRTAAPHNVFDTAQRDFRTDEARWR